MGILIADNFNYKGRKPLDERLVYNLLSDMKAVADSVIYEGAIAYCKEDKKFYTFDPSNTVDTITGKWREMTTGSSGTLVEEYVQNKDYTKDSLVYLDSKLARVKVDFKSNSTALTVHDSFDIDLVTNLALVSGEKEILPYIRNFQYKQDVLVYVGSKVARVKADYTSDNTASKTDNESFELDIDAGSLLLISGDEFKVHSLTTDTLKEKINDNKTILIPATFTDVKVGHLVYDSNGYIGKIVSLDLPNNTMVVITISNNGDKPIRYKAKNDLDDEILKQQTITLSDLDMTSTIDEIKINQLIYDKVGTVAKVDSVDTTTGDIKVTTITAVGKSFNLDFYEYKKTLKKDVGQVQTIPIADINATVTINDFEENQVVYDLEGTLSKIETIDKLNNEITVRIVSSSSSASVREYKTSDILSLTIDAQQVIGVPTGVNIKTIKTDQLVYDENGTVAKVVSVDETNNQITVQTITGLGMPTAPDTKQPKVTKGGTGYAPGDIIETADAGFFVEVTNVDATGAILDVIDSTITVTSTSGTGAEINREQVIYGGFGKNWAKLSDAAVRVATTVAEKFEYEVGHTFTIDNAGTGYTVGNIIPTDKTGTNVIISNTDASGEILSVSFTREALNTPSGTGAVITATQDANIFVISDKYWNMGITLFSLTNDDGAWVQFLRVEDSLVKYSAGPNGKVYKFVYNPLNGTITQSSETISAGGSTEGVTFEDSKSYLEGDLIMRNNKLYKCTQDYTSTNDFDTDLANSYWEQYQVVEEGGEIV